MRKKSNSIDYQKKSKVLKKNEIIDILFRVIFSYFRLKKNTMIYA